MAKTVIQLKKQGCAPCTMVDGFLESNNIKTEKYDVFESPEMAAKYDIGSVPVTILLDEEGAELQRSIGFNPPELEDMISKLQ